MAQTEYTTIPAISKEDTAEWPVILAKPGNRINGKTPTMGNTAAFKSDVTWAITESSTINAASAITFSGENGKDHWESYKFGDAGCIFPRAEVIRGFQLENTQDSTAGHGLYLRRMGLVFRNSAGTEEFWGGAPRSRPSSFNKQVWKRELTDSDRTKLKGFFVRALIVEVSTQGGTGTRPTSLSLGGFKLLYDVGTADTRWVVGKMRTVTKLSGEGSIQFI